MKTPDEIKKGLEHCSDDGCKNCPYEQDCNMADGFSVLADDALAYIQQLEDQIRDLTKKVEQLEADNAQQARCIENMTDMLNAAHDETAMLKAQGPKWISVEERLPENTDDVLMVTNWGIGLGYYDIYCDSWIDYTSTDTNRVTHWMPLPEPPKEDVHGQEA